MYKPKFEAGNIVTPRTDKPRIFHHNWDDIIFQVIEIVRLNNTFYYKFDNETIKYVNSPLFPAVDVDDYYELDIMFLRKWKLNKLIYKTKIK